jgi:hypothetical protein
MAATYTYSAIEELCFLCGPFRGYIASKVERSELAEWESISWREMAASLEVNAVWCRKVKSCWWVSQRIAVKSL